MNKQDREERDKAVMNDFMNNFSKKDIALKNNVSITTVDTILKAHYWCHNKPRKRPKNVPTEKALSIINSPDNGESLKIATLLQKVTIPKTRPSNGTAEKALSIINSFNNGASVKSLSMVHNVTKQRIHQILKSGGIKSTRVIKNLVTDEAISHYLCNKTSKLKVCEKFNIPIHYLKKYLIENKIKKPAYDSINHNLFIEYYINRNYSLPKTAELLGIDVNHAGRYRTKFSITKGGQNPHEKSISQEAIELYLTTNITQPELAKMLNMTVTTLRKKLSSKGIKKPRRHHPKKKTQ